jgi:hypothetical protein
VSVVLFTTPGYYDVLAVGGGRGFNPGTPELAQELVDTGIVRNASGKRIEPGTWYVEAATSVSLELWTKLNAGAGPTSRAS